jgi:phosphotransacetylase
MIDAAGPHGALLDRWTAAARDGRVVLAEGDDPRVVEAAARLLDRGVGAVHLVVRSEDRPIAALRDRSGGRLVVHHLDELAADPRLRAAIEAALAGRELGPSAIARLGRDPVALAAAMVRLGDVDAAVAGAVTESAAVARAAIRIVGRAAGRSTVSGAFLMLLPDGRPVTFSDCAVVPVPTADQLVEIAADAAALHDRLTGEAPAVAFLSFSTLGSASHPSVDLVREAVARFRARLPDVAADGELQFDAAFVPAVAARKAPRSAVAGRANVFVFPNLDAGNLGYKIAERLGGATAIGPLLLGLARPMNDLSRGCSVDDIECVALVSVALGRSGVAATDEVAVVGQRRGEP